MLLAHGGSFGGYSFFVNKDQKLQFSHNYLGIDEYKVISKEKVPTGKVTLRMEFKRTGPPDFKIGKGAPGTVQAVHQRQAGRRRRRSPSPAHSPTASPATACRAAGTRSPPSAPTTWAASSLSRRRSAG